MSPTTDALAPLAVSERTAERIRQKITKGEFSPGQRLSEQALSTSLGVSRNTLREVFRVLSKDGLLRHEPNRGVFVAEPSLSAIIDIYRVRRMIECQALAQACTGHPARKHMRKAVQEALRARDAGDWLAVGTANMDFHMAVVELADSERLNAMYDRLLAELRLAFGLLQDPEYLHAPYVDRNAQILDLVDTDAFAKASQAMLDYLTQSERVVLAVFSRRQSNIGRSE